MIRLAVITILAVMLCPAAASAIERVKLDDRYDDAQRLQEVSRKEAVRLFADDLEQFRQEMLRKTRRELHQLFGGPTEPKLADFALPVA